MNIIRYHPLTVNHSFDAAFDDLFQGFFRPVARGEAQPQQIKIDVTEHEGAYVVHADIPGVKKEDIQVSIDGNQVTISAKVSRQEESGAKIVHTERYYGKVLRSFTLAQDIEDTSAQAKYHAGVLELTLPKKAETKAKKLTIQ